MFVLWWAVFCGYFFNLRKIGEYQNNEPNGLGVFFDYQSGILLGHFKNGNFLHGGFLKNSLSQERRGIMKRDSVIDDVYILGENQHEWYFFIKICRQKF